MKNNCYDCRFSEIGNICWCKKKIRVITSPYITKCKYHKEEKK